MESLIMLDLSDNELSGTIPWCMGNISDSLEIFYLQRNKFQGSISLVFSRKSELTSLHLNGNQFEGALPISLPNCTKLEILDLGNNLLNDTFPNWLESLPDLQVLVLRANRWHGPIENTAAKFSFPKLIIMDLSRNKFTGDLPIRYFEKSQVMPVGLESADSSYVGATRNDGQYYQNSTVVSMKGSDIELVRILIIFRVLDFSVNNSTGEIPSVVGKL